MNQTNGKTADASALEANEVSVGLARAHGRIQHAAEMLEGNGFSVAARTDIESRRAVWTRNKAEDEMQGDWLFRRRVESLTGTDDRAFLEQLVDKSGELKDDQGRAVDERSDQGELARATLVALDLARTMGAADGPARIHVEKRGRQIIAAATLLDPTTGHDKATRVQPLEAGKAAPGDTKPAAVVAPMMDPLPPHQKPLGPKEITIASPSRVLPPAPKITPPKAS